MTVTANDATALGQTEPVQIHFDHLDAMGVVHNGRYVLLLERAIALTGPGQAGPSTPASRTSPKCSSW
jgi:hypothetical protein